MPRVKPLIRTDPLEAQLRSEIASGMARMQINAKELSKMTGIRYSTLITRIGKGGDIKSLRIGELIEIRRVFRKGGTYGD